LTFFLKNLKLESDIEWKFSRSKLYMQYIKEGGSLPVPFNIIPTPKTISNSIKKLIELKNKKEIPKPKIELNDLTSNGIQPKRNGNCSNEPPGITKRRVWL
jgi:hypothetical protein